MDDRNISPRATALNTWRESDTHRRRSLNNVCLCKAIRDKMTLDLLIQSVSDDDRPCLIEIEVMSLEYMH